MSKAVGIYWREYRDLYPDISAHLALSWARESVAVDELEQECEWFYPNDLLYPRQDRPSDPIAVAQFEGFAIRVYADPWPYDWGDCEPSESERETLEVIGVGVRLDDDDSDLDVIWSWGYSDGNGERNALQCAHCHGFIAAARSEIAERERLAGYVGTV